MRHFYWIYPSDNQIQLGNTPQSFISSYSGLGYAPLEHFLSPQPSQHTQLHRGLKFRPRTIQLAIWDFQSSITAQDTRHQTLLAALNADSGEGILKVVLDGGTERRIGCYVAQGPDFDSDGRIDAFQSYMLRFVARNPFFYNPSPVVENDNFNGAASVDVVVTNNGHVNSFPIFTLNAPVNKPKIRLVTTGEYIELNYNLTAGQIIIDCEAGTIMRGSVDEIDKLTKGSTLFSIPSGTHTLQLTATAGNGAFGVSFYERYLGI